VAFDFLNLASIFLSAPSPGLQNFVELKTNAITEVRQETGGVRPGE
jgi:hypothetical protein